jgi:hypothetical protein
MSDSLKDKRVIFPKGRQHAFLIKSLKRLDLPWSELASKIRVHPRTLNDWKREKYSMPLLALQKIREITNVKMPTDIEIRDRFWYAKKGGEIAGKLVYEKYGVVGGNPKRRRRKWLQWWNKKGKFNLAGYFVPKDISKPKKDIKLAEFVGIMIGDGGITEKQVTVTLNYITDKEYINFVSNLFKKLFTVEPALYKREKESIVNIVVSRVKLVRFCKSLGLKVGNKLKQKVDIPNWIKKEAKYKTACLRGLMDTDGCIFNECHNINNKRYCYPRLSFVSYSKNLRCSVFKILSELGFHPKIRNNRSVQLENREDIIKYFNLVGTHNPKHKQRFKSFLEG